MEEDLQVVGDHSSPSLGVVLLVGVEGLGRVVGIPYQVGHGVRVGLGEDLASDSFVEGDHEGDHGGHHVDHQGHRVDHLDLRVDHQAHHVGHLDLHVDHLDLHVDHQGGLGALEVQEVQGDQAVPVPSNWVVG